MPKKRRTAKSSHRSRGLPREQERVYPRRSGGAASMVEIAGLVLAVIGLLGLIALWPRPTLRVEAPLNPGDPFSAPFAFSNDSYFNLRDVQFSCRVRRAMDANRNQFINNYSSGYVRVTQTLRAGDVQTIPCFTGVYTAAPYVSADIEIIAQYKLPLILIPWLQTKRFRFQLTREADGTPRWLRQPLD